MKVILISGFLGSGKTSFIKNNIDKFSNKKVAVIINEYASITIDETSFEDRYSISVINNGTIFCVCKISEFYREVERFYNMGIDYLFVETSGFTKLTTIHNVIDFLKTKYNIIFNDIIVIVDASKITKWLRINTNALDQIQKASVIIINKIDLVSDTNLKMIEEIIKEKNHKSKVFKTVNCMIDIKKVLRKKRVKLKIEGFEIIRDKSYESVVIDITKNYHMNDYTNILSDILEGIYRIKGYVKIDQDVYYLDYSHELKFNLVSSYKNLNKLVVLFSLKDISKEEIINRFNC